MKRRKTVWRVYLVLDKGWRELGKDYTRVKARQVRDTFKRWFPTSQYIARRIYIYE